MCGGNAQRRDIAQHRHFRRQQHLGIGDRNSGAIICSPLTRQAVAVTGDGQRASIGSGVRLVVGIAAHGVSNIWFKSAARHERRRRNGGLLAAKNKTSARVIKRARAERVNAATHLYAPLGGWFKTSRLGNRRSPYARRSRHKTPRHGAP